jgi:hypothetical protein
MSDAMFPPQKMKMIRRTIRMIRKDRPDADIHACLLSPHTVSSAFPLNRQAQLVERALAGDAYTDDDLVFCDELGRPIQPKTLSYRFGRARAKAGTPPVRYTRSGIRPPRSCS